MVSYRASDPSKARNLDDCGKLLAWIFISVGGFVVLAALVNGAMFLLCFRILAVMRAAQDTPDTATPIYKHPESEDTLEDGLPATWEPTVRHCNAVLKCAAGFSHPLHFRLNRANACPWNHLSIWSGSESLVLQEYERQV